MYDYQLKFIADRSTSFSLCSNVSALFRSHAISAYRSVFTDAVVEQFVWRELVLNAV